MRWIESDGNQELLKWSEPFLEIKGLLHLEINFNAIPSNYRAAVLRKVECKEEQASGERMHGRDDLCRPSWEGIGRDLEPGSRSVYEISVFEEDDMYRRKEPNAMIMNRVYISSERK